MSEEGYLNEILQHQTLSDDGPEMQDMDAHVARVTALIVKTLPDCDVSIDYGGSRAKGTMIKENYDADVVVYFGHGEFGAGSSLSDIFKSIGQILSEEYRVVERTSALRLHAKKYDIDFHLDVVPGRYTDDHRRDVFINQNGVQKERLKTNLRTHIAHIRDSGLTQTIRLAKLWNCLEGLKIKTFVLELLVVKALEGSTEVQLGLPETLRRFWKYLVAHEQSLTVEDPANPYGNDLSGYLEDVRNRLSGCAKTALQASRDGNWEDIFGPSPVTSQKPQVSIIVSAVQAQKSAVKPWRP